MQNPKIGFRFAQGLREIRGLFLDDVECVALISFSCVFWYQEALLVARNKTLKKLKHNKNGGGVHQGASLRAIADSPQIGQLE